MRRGPAVSDQNARTRSERLADQLQHLPYQLFMLAVSVLSLLVISLTMLPGVSSDIRALLNIVDLVLCAIFFVDFLFQFITAPDRWRYMRWGWLDLLSSIPMTDASRYARLARILRIVRILRAVRSARVILQFLQRHRGESIIWTTAFMSLVLMLVGSIGILEFERGQPESNIHTAGDAFWWTFVTITTVGYGDHYPVTTGGRLTAAAVMLAGVGVFAVFTGAMASLFQSRPKEPLPRDEPIPPEV